MRQVARIARTGAEPVLGAFVAQSLLHSKNQLCPLPLQFKILNCRVNRVLSRTLDSEKASFRMFKFEHKRVDNWLCPFKSMVEFGCRVTINVLIFGLPSGPVSC